MIKKPTSTSFRVAVVTGGASGIGKGIALRFASEGYLVVIADINLENAESAAAELNTKSNREDACFGIQMDVRSEKSVDKGLNSIHERWGRIDVLAANAGVYPGSPIEQISEEDWEFVLQINLRGVFFCIKHVLPYMRSQHFGRIIITSSVTGQITGFPGWSHYGASKAGLLGLMRSVALEVITEGITVNSVMPGNVKTPAWNDLPEEYLESTEKAIPMGRLADPADIANAVAFFADARSGYISGQTLVVDGGQVLPEIPMR